MLLHLDFPRIEVEGQPSLASCAVTSGRSHHELLVRTSCAASLAARRRAAPAASDSFRNVDLHRLLVLAENVVHCSLTPWPLSVAGLNQMLEPKWLQKLSHYIYKNTCVCGRRFILYKVFVSITSTCTVINPLQWIPRVDTLDTLSIAKNHPPLSHRFLKWRISNWENERLKQAQVS